MISAVKRKAKQWLLWSQQYTRTDMLYLAKGGFWLSLGDVAASVFSFLMALAFAHLVSRQTYGTYQYILSVIATMGIFSLTGLGSALTRSVAQGKEGSLIPVVTSAVRWATLGGIGSLVVGLYYLVHHNTLLAGAFFLAAIFIPFKDTLSLYQSYLEGKKQFDREAKYIVITQLIAASILVSVIVLFGNLYAILLAYLAPRILLNLFFLVKTARSIPESAEYDPGAVHYGKHLTAIRLLSFVMEQLDTLLLWNLLGAGTVALYSFSLAPINQIRGLLNTVTVLAFPKLASNTREGLKTSLPYKVLFMLLIMAGVTGVYILIAPLFFHIFFPAYADAIGYSRVYALSLLFLPRNIISDAMVAHGEKKKLYLSSILNSAVRIPTMVILISLFGIWGAIYSYLASGVFSFGLAIYFFFFHRSKEA